MENKGDQRIRDIMTIDVITVQEKDTVETCANLLSKHNLSGLPVVSQAGYIRGMVTEGDLIRRVSTIQGPAYLEILGGLFYLETAKELMEEVQRAKGNLARDVMTKDVYTISPDASVEEAATLMVNRKVKRLPVVDGEEVIGIVSRKDIMHYLFYK